MTPPEPSSASRPVQVHDESRGRDGRGPTVDAPPAPERPVDADAGSGAPARERRGGMSRWLAWGAVSGLLAGAAFMAITVWSAAGTGPGAWAPFLTAATVVEGPPPATATVGVGVVVHVLLSVLLGVVFALATAPARRRSAGWLAWAGLLFGGAAYLVDFVLLARNVAYFAAFRAADQPLGLAAHLVFGAVLAALLLLAKPRTARRRP